MMPRQLVDIELSLKGAFYFNIHRTSIIRREVFWTKASSSETSVNICQSRSPKYQKTGDFISAAVRIADVVGFVACLYYCGGALRVS